MDVKDVCHLWELGGGELYTNLLETPLSGVALPGITAVVMVDLTKPEKIWTTLQTLLQVIKVGQPGRLNMVSF